MNKTHLLLSSSQHQSMFDLVVAVAQHSDDEIKFALLWNDRMPRMDVTGKAIRGVISGAETDGTDTHSNNPKKDGLAQIVSTCQARTVAERELTVKAERNARGRTEWVEEMDTQPATRAAQVEVAA